MPLNQAAWLVQAHDTSLEVKEAPFPSPGPNEIVIANHAVAINPVDWKMQDHGILIDSYPTIFGCDVAGAVEIVGRSVRVFQQGDRVIA